MELFFYWYADLTTFCHIIINNKNCREKKIINQVVAIKPGIKDFCELITIFFIIYHYLHIWVNAFRESIYSLYIWFRLCVIIQMNVFVKWLRFFLFILYIFSHFKKLKYWCCYMAWHILLLKAVILTLKYGYGRSTTTVLLINQQILVCKLVKL